MIFDAHGNPVRLVILITKDSESGFVVGAYSVDEAPMDDDLDQSVLDLYCHQMQIEDEEDINKIQDKIYNGTIQAIAAVFESEEVLPFYEPIPDVSDVPLTEEDVSRMSADELIEYRDILLEQSKEYAQDPTLITHNAELIADEMRRRLK